MGAVVPVIKDGEQYLDPGLSFIQERHNIPDTR